MLFSIIIPIYNRPDELDELLDSLTKQSDKGPLEVIIVEDGSSIKSDAVVKKYSAQLDIHYFYKNNTGPGDSRNYGMQKAKGDYFIILDSDTIVPPHYLSTVRASLQVQYVDAYGGPDMSADDFSEMQKAITYAMTSLLTTGGIRGKKKQVSKFQPRSFNMGISRKAFENTGGFAPMRVGEDVDLSIHLWENGFQTKLIEDAGVFHKRRSTLKSFSIQVHQFGAARPIIFKRHPQYKSLVFWFPAVFLLGSLTAFTMFGFSFYTEEPCQQLLKIPFYLWVLYSILNFIFSSIQFKSLKVGLLSIVTSWVQLYSYGLGFLKSYILVHLLGKKPEDAFPTHFYQRD